MLTNFVNLCANNVRKLRHQEVDEVDRDMAGSDYGKAFSGDADTSWHVLKRHVKRFVLQLRFQSEGGQLSSTT